MSEPAGREAARFAALEASLPHIAALGWTQSALRAGGGPDADLLFPGGQSDMLEAYVALADQRMVSAAAPLLDNQRLSQRMRTLIATRLEQAEPEKAAIRRALGLLALPRHAALSARTLARTVDTIWAAAGDTSADFSWYTKRAILASVYTTTLLFWLNNSTTQESTLAFLDRRLQGVARLGKLRARLLPT